MELSLARKTHFSCGHRYFNAKLSEEENKKIFGSCYSEHGHGHNYTLEAFFTGPIDSDTGMIINLRDIDQLLKTVTSTLDHKHLNFDHPYFKSVIPTTENICIYLFDKIKIELPNNIKLKKIRLYENEDLWVDCHG